MAEKVDGWMPLHIGAYVAATRHLSTLEHGMYLLLLMHAWNNGGELPAADDRLARIAGASPKEWKGSRDVILAFFTKQPDGTFRQKRLDVELAKSTSLKAERSEAGSKGAASRWQKHGKAIGQEMATPIAEPMAQPQAKPMAKAWPIPKPLPETLTPPLPPPCGVGSVDNSNPKPRSSGQWWKTPEGIEAEGKRLGIPARVGESHGDYAQRLRAQRERVA